MVDAVVEVVDLGGSFWFDLLDDLVVGDVVDLWYDLVVEAVVDLDDLRYDLVVEAVVDLVDV